MRICVIDIGSNSIRYMEAESTNDGFRFSPKTVRTTRLAEGLSSSGRLSSAAMERSVSVLKEFADCAAAQSLPAFCYATSAVRDAENGPDFVHTILETTGLPTEVLSGEEEARLAWAGSAKSGGGLIDIGGGSSQIITDTFRKSFPVGCVRIRDWCQSQTLSDLEQLIPKFDRIYSLPEFGTLSWSAVGGTATTLGALSLGLKQYDPALVSSAVLSSDQLLDLLHRLDAMGDERRAENPLLFKRHNVIIGGGFLLHYLMQRIKISEIAVSDADGLEGYAMKVLRDLHPSKE